ncbi:VOC family protein [Micromonospora sp. WMMD558]|uniref:VOC family protein n=1 Tax=Micromonospora sp. WMMD558 TaxID=3403462 RepID=UPI003BF5812F
MTTFRGVSPYLYYTDAAAALDWLARVFGFVEQVRYLDPDGVVREAEMTVGDVPIHLCGLDPDHWQRQGLPGPTGQLTIVYVDDVDVHHAHAVAAGAVADPPETKDYSARTYLVRDPGGNSWCFWQPLDRPVRLRDGWSETRPEPVTARRGDR